MDDNGNFDYSFADDGTWGPRAPSASGGPPVFANCLLRDAAEVDIKNIPPREFIYGKFMIRGFVSCEVGTGGTGKTSHCLGVAMSIASGISVFSTAKPGEDDEYHVVHIIGPVVYFNLEDPQDEMDRRVAAEMLHRGFKPEDMRNRLYTASGRDSPFCVASVGKGGKIVRHDIQPAIDLLIQYGIVAMFVDPLINTHELDGNRNDHIAIVIDQFRQIAHAANCAICLVHHFRKGGVAGDVESSMGGITLTNGCRAVETLTTMTLEDAAILGIKPERRRGYVRLDNAKANLAAPPAEHDWYQFHSVPLTNGTPTYPKGDTVGVLMRWRPTSALHSVSWRTVEAMLDQIDAGTGGGAQVGLPGTGGIGQEYYSSARQSTRWVGTPIMAHLGITAEAAVLQIKEWLATGVLMRDDYMSKSRSRQPAERIQSTPAGRDRLRRFMETRP
jgi:AAA domain